MHPFKAYILKIANLEEVEWKRIETCLKRKEYRKGDIILENGEVCTKLYFVEDGFSGSLFGTMERP